MGELVDKLTILDLKSERIRDPEKLANIQKEKEMLGPCPDVGPFRDLLYKINSVLWDVEDRLRVCETEENFGPEFILLARSVYFTNDMRCRVKNQISKILGEQVKEMKSYID